MHSLAHSLGETRVIQKYLIWIHLYSSDIIHSKNMMQLINLSWSMHQLHNNARSICHSDIVMCLHRGYANKENLNTSFHSAKQKLLNKCKRMKGKNEQGERISQREALCVGVEVSLVDAANPLRAGFPISTLGWTIAFCRGAVDY